MKQPIRVRFAPSPTGFMHLGNIRAALMNYLFAKKFNGSFILRIEDTDQKRNVENSLQTILSDLAWLKLDFQEGPGKEKGCAPYFQSQRTTIYQEVLQELTLHQKAYRCFCTAETLDEKRQQQIQQGKPPRYDKTCLLLSQEKVKQKIAFGKPFVWRLKLNELQTLSIHDLGKGVINFEMKNYSDFVLARQDGSVTFTFANFVDDWKMNISHVIRGQDHLSNTAYQAALFDAIAVKPPTYWHLPIICNNNGEKMSKRDFGFALKDLQQEGYLPEAILNYLGTLGISLPEEVLSIENLCKVYPFDKAPSGGNISHNQEKLSWFNQEWISSLSSKELFAKVYPLITEHYPQAIQFPENTIMKLLEILKPEAKTISQMVPLAKFFFIAPKVSLLKLYEDVAQERCEIVLAILASQEPNQTPQEWLQAIKKEAKDKQIKIKELFQTLRYILTGSTHGLGIKELLEVLALEEVLKRIMTFSQ